MNETLLSLSMMVSTMLPALLIGSMLGAIFFGGLYWTVRKSVSSAQPALWLFGSLLLRMSMALSGFYFVGHSHWERLLVCLLGFIIARFIVLRLTRGPIKRQDCPTRQTRHAA